MRCFHVFRPLFLSLNLAYNSLSPIIYRFIVHSWLPNFFPQNPASTFNPQNGDSLLNSIPTSVSPPFYARRRCGLPLHRWTSRRSRPPPPPHSTLSPPMSPPHNNHFSWMVPTFVVINIGLFALALYINDCPSHSTDCVAQDLLGRFAFQSLRENPLLGPSASTLQLMGALEVKKVVEEHEVWRLLSCSWLHAGVLHVLANMVSLLFVGIRLEEEFGFVRIGLLYIISGLGGSLLSALFIRTTISVGASGALFGLLGGMLSELLTNWTIYTNKFAALLTLILIIAINLAVGILPHVDNFAHVGGFVTGFFLGFVFLIRPQYAWVRQRYSPPGYIGIKSKPKYKVYQFIFLVISLIILIIGLTAGLVLLLSGVDGNNYCSWCHHLRCVPTPFWKCNSEQVYCESNISGNQLNLKCLSNRKSKLYTLEGTYNTTYLEHLCSELCS